MSHLKRINGAQIWALFIALFFVLSSTSLAEEDPDEKMLRELEARQLEMKKKIEDMQKTLPAGNRSVIQKVTQEMEKGNFDVETIQKILKDNQSPEDVAQQKEMMKESLKIVRSRPRADVEAQIKENIQKLPVGKDMIGSDKVVKKLVDVMYDEEALPSMMVITANRTKLMYFVGCNILVFLLAFYLKKRAQKLEKFTEKVNSFFGRLFFVFLMRMGILVFFYGDNLKPLFRVLLA